MSGCLTGGCSRSSPLHRKGKEPKYNPCVGRAFFRVNAFRGKRVDAAESLGREITRFNEELLNGQPGRPMSAAKFFLFLGGFF